MATLIPDDFSTLPQKLTEGEKALINALCQILDDKWTVYVQPYLNGLRPDVIIFCEDAGVGIFEVKDWNLDAYRIQGDRNNGYKWEVRAQNTGKWTNLPKEECPLKQVEKYRDSIFKHEIPILGSKKILDKAIFSLIQPYVYFHKHKTADVKNRIAAILDEYSNVFGWDDLEPQKLLAILGKRRLRHGSNFTNLMQDIGLGDRLANALALPKHGMTNIENLLNLTKKQRQLLDRMEESGRIRIKGAAGSGKTLLLGHKAARAATQGKRVLVVCFNITMVNYIQDLVKRLARYYGEQYDQPNCYRNIEVGHYHRIFPLKKEKTEGDQTEKQPILDNRNVKEPVEVLLIDEGQDFERAWVDNLLKLCGLNYEFMLCEDRRQNIYGREEIKAEAMPIPGRPSELKESFRIPEQTAKLANFISDYTKLEVTEVVESIKPNQGNLFVRNLWFNGTETKAIKALEADIKSLTKDGNNARPDIAILVCTVEDGWKTCQLLNLLKLPYQSSFESEEESKRLKKMYPDKKEFKKFRDQVRRGYKAGFWMQGGKIKVATIHSFKGWELSNILVFFHPSEEKQGKNRVELLYTAITRSQECLTIYNLDPLFDKFGDVAIAEGYIQRHPLQSTSA